MDEDMYVVWNNMDQNEGVPIPFQKYAKVKERAHFDISLWHLEQDEFIVIFNVRILFFLIIYQGLMRLLKLSSLQR
jgi:hypothetical protein